MNAKAKSVKITKDTKLIDAIKANKSAGKVFGGYDMGCVSCGGAQNETVEYGARTHGVGVEELVKKLNKK